MSFSIVNLSFSRERDKGVGEKEPHPCPSPLQVEGRNICNCHAELVSASLHKMQRSKDA